MLLNLKYFLPALSLLLCTRTIHAQPAPVTKSTFISGKDTLPYRLIQPLHKQASAKYPLVVYLQGSGGRGNDNERPFNNLHATFRDTAWQAKHPCYILVPQCPVNSAWAWFSGFPGSIASSDTPSRASRMVVDLVRQLMEEKNIDQSRIYLTGFSMGGEGTFDIISREPRLFACAVPLASVADTSRAYVVKDLPIWAFHGTDDRINDVVYSRMMIAAIKRAGGNPKYTECAGVQHDCRNEAYNNAELWKWMFAQRRKKR